MPAASSVQEFGSFRLDSAERLLLRGGQAVSLPPKAFDLLVYLVDHAGRLVLGDEAFTPDSSRFWPADEYQPGATPSSFDKQFVRDYCEQLGWDKTPPGPELPDDVVVGTRARYVEAFERLTGIAFADYLTDPGVVSE